MSKTYGYGVSETAVVPTSVQHVLNLLHCAPWLEKQCLEKLTLALEEGETILDLDMDTVLEYLNKVCNSGYMKSVVPILHNVILEAEGFDFTCEPDFEGEEFLYLPPTFPWNAEAWAKDLTETQLHDIFLKYVSIVTDTPGFIGIVDIYT